MVKNSQRRIKNLPLQCYGIIRDVSAAVLAGMPVAQNDVNISDVF